MLRLDSAEVLRQLVDGRSHGGNIVLKLSSGGLLDRDLFMERGDFNLLCATFRVLWCGLRA